MATFNELKQRDNYQLVTLATIEPALKVKESDITSLGGNLWSVAVESRPTRLSVDGVEGTEVTDTPNASLEWKYNEATGTVTFYTTSVTNKYILIWVLFFFASKPTSLPWDLGSGSLVPWKSFISQVSSFNQTIDSETRSVPFESSGSIALLNDLEFFQPKIRKYIWDNKEVKVYRWALESSAYDPELLYTGVVTDMSYNRDSVAFQFSNVIRKLKAPVSVCEYFNTNDGFFPLEQRSYVKRIPFGRVNGLSLYQTDMNIGPSPLTTTVSYTNGSPIVSVSANALFDAYQGDTLTLPTGSYTVNSHGKVDYGISSTSTYEFAWPLLNLTITNTNADFSDVAAGDIMVLTPQPGFNQGIGTVIQVSSSTIEVSIIDAPGYAENTVSFDQNTLSFYRQGMSNLTLSSNVNASGSTTNAAVTDNISKASKNHEFLVSPLPLFICEKTLTEVDVSAIRLNDVEHLRVGDKVEFDSIEGFYTISFINAALNFIEFETMPNGLSVGDTLRRPSVQSAWFKNSLGNEIRLSPVKDFYTVTNSGAEKLTVYNSVREESQTLVIDCQVRGPFIMENVPGTVSGGFANYVVGDALSFYNTNIYDFPAECIIVEKINDYCVIAYPDKASPYSSVYESMLLATSEASVPVTVKKVKNFDNNTELFVDTYGIANGSNFIETPYDVMDYVLGLSGESYDAAEIAELSANNTALVSLALPPEKAARTVPSYLDVLKLMAISAQSSVHLDDSAKITASPFLAPRSSNEITVNDFSMLDLPDININNKAAAKRIKVTYGVVDYSENFVQVTRDEAVYEELAAGDAANITVYLYDVNDVIRYANRELLFRRGAKTELSFSVAPRLTPGFMDVVRCDSRINPEIFRITTDTVVQGVVTNLEIGAGIVSTVTIDDMSGYYDNISAIAPNTLPIYSEASNEDSQAFGWIGDGSLIS